MREPRACAHGYGYVSAERFRHSRVGSIAASRIDVADLRVERAEVVNDADQETTACQQVEQTGHPFAHVETMDAKDAQKGEEHPRKRVFEMAGDKPAIRLPVHAWNEKQIYEPADQKQAAGEEPQDASLGFAEVKTMSPSEAEDPEDVADQLVVGGGKRGVVHSGPHHEEFWALCDSKFGRFSQAGAEEWTK